MLWYKRFIIGTSYHPILGEAGEVQKGELEDQRKSLTSPLEAQCRWITQARKWEARPVQLPSGTPKESRWRHPWKTVATASGSGPGVTVCQQGHQPGTRVSCRTSTKTRWNLQAAYVCLSLCLPLLTQSVMAAVSLLSSKSHADVVFIHL